MKSEKVEMLKQKAWKEYEKVAKQALKELEK